MPFRNDEPAQRDWIEDMGKDSDTLRATASFLNLEGVHLSRQKPPWTGCLPGPFQRIDKAGLGGRSTPGSSGYPKVPGALLCT